MLLALVRRQTRTGEGLERGGVDDFKEEGFMAFLAS